MNEHTNVERLAYELWERDGRPEGKAEEHYFRAERLIMAGELASEVARRTTAPAARPPATPKAARSARPRTRKKP